MILLRRLFEDGYTFYHKYNNKYEALMKAKSRRKKKHRARVVKVGDYYEVWEKKPPKKREKKKLIKENDILWSLIVRKRDGYVCQLCRYFFETGVKDEEPIPSKYMAAHHIFGRSKKATRWDTRNGITLCYYHHRFYIHGGKMTPSEMAEFYEWFLGKDTYEELEQKSRETVRFNYDFVKEWNEKLREEFEMTFGKTFEEWKKERR